MTIFSGFLKIVRRNSAIALIYILMFIIINIGISSSLKKVVKKDYEISRPGILVIDEGRTTEMKRALFEMIGITANLTFVEDALAAKDAVVSQEADYVFVIGEDAELRLKNGEPAIEVFYELGNPAGILAETQVRKILMYMDAYYRTYGEIDYDAIGEAMKEGISVKIESENIQTMSRTDYFKQYMKFFHYIFISISLFVISPLLLQINKGALRTRCSVSSLRPSEYYFQLALAVTVLTTLFIIIFVLFGLAIVDFEVETRTLLLLIGNIFVFGLSLMSFVVLISNLPVSPRVVSSIANIFSIVVAFTTGIFVPVEFLPESVVSLSKFFPAYYSVHITTGENLATGVILYDLGVQLLFALVFSLGAIYLNRSRRREVLNVKTSI